MLARVAVAAALAATAYAGVPAAPAAAAGCPTDTGVTVVVDYHQLGGGVQSVCLADGGGDRASDLFPAAGFALDYVQRQPGFVCRVSGRPADSPCVNTPPGDAYWALFWSDGESGAWTYATTGASGLTVPDGGYVAFSWQGSSTRAEPGTSPAAHAPPPPTPTRAPTTKPTQQPTKQPTKAPGQQPSASGSASTSASPSGSASASERAKREKREKRGSASATPSTGESAEPSPSATEASAVPASSDPAEPDGGLPAWVAPVVVLVLFGAAGAVAVARRRRTGAV